MDEILQMDPGAGYRAARLAIDAAIARVLASGWYIQGPEVSGFETAFARFLGLDAAAGVANGTDALILALKAAGIGPGDRVATVAHTAVATVTAIVLAGAEPVLVDIEPGGFAMDPVSLQRTLAQVPGVRAVVPVHLYGIPANITDILAVAAQYGALVIEDCAQAHGAQVGAAAVGSFGVAGSFSFYPTKNLGALGDGGMVVSPDTALIERVRILREYGWKSRYVSAVEGMNSRLDAIQAAILSARLPGLAADNARRCAIAARYDAGLADLPLVLPRVPPGTTPVWHQYVIRSQNRDGLRAHLAAAGIGTNIHYPVPIHRQPAYAGRLIADPAGLGLTEAAAGEILSLPLYPQLPDRSVDRVIAVIKGFFA